jgi:hypothetical protein
VRAARLKFAYAPVSRLSAGELAALWTVYSAFFDTERTAFERAVERSDEVIRFHDANDGRLCGMALISAYAASHEGRDFRVLSTGAVCLEPPYRGLNAVQRAGLFRLARERLRHPLSDVYWYFDTFSYKSYLLLPRNLPEYWPRADRSTPAWESGVIAVLAQRHGGEAWNPITGVIGAQGRRLRPGVAEVLPADHNPHVRFFLRRNPGHAAGERLPCLCPLNLRNVAAIARTAARRGWRRDPSF